MTDEKGGRMTDEKEHTEAVDAVVAATHTVLDALVDWLHADGPNAQAEALETLYRVGIAYEDRASVAWPPDEEEA